MIDVEPKDLTVQQVQKYLLGGVAPRPIALVSTISEDSIRNLAPFSFFNAFGANPPTVAFSPSRRGRDGTTKDTFQNLCATKECVVQVVPYSLVHQVNLASAEFEAGVDEFIKSGLTPVSSDLIKPDRVKESPFQMECRLQQMIELGGKPGSGNLAICEVIKFHIEESIMREGVIHPDLIDLAGRNSASFYTRASGEAIFELPKPDDNVIGYDSLPEFVRRSEILSANDLGQLGTFTEIPSDKETLLAFENIAPSQFSNAAFLEYRKQKDYKCMFVIADRLNRQSDNDLTELVESSIKNALQQDDPATAWKMIVATSMMHSEDD